MSPLRRDDGLREQAIVGAKHIKFDCKNSPFWAYVQGKKQISNSVIGAAFYRALFGVEGGRDE